LLTFSFWLIDSPGFSLGVQKYNNFSVNEYTTALHP